MSIGILIGADYILRNRDERNLLHLLSRRFSSPPDYEVPAPSRISNFIPSEHLHHPAEGPPHTVGDPHHTV